MRSLALPGILALAVLSACGSDNGSDPTPTCTVTAVAITGGGVTRAVGETVQLTAQLTSANCTTPPAITWSSQPAGRVTISATGLVTAVAAGAVTITATAGGVSGTTQVTITEPPPAEVRFLVDSVVLGVGDEFTLAAEARTAANVVVPAPGLIWSLIDAGPITIAAGGRVTGVTEGATARVQVRLGDLTDTAKVWVVRRRLGFLWNQFAAGDGTWDADAEYSWSTAVGTNTIARPGDGQYVINWPHLQRAGQETEVVLASAYGTPFGSWCHVDSWTSITAAIRCRNSAGALTNGSFTAALVGSASLRGRSGFAWIQTDNESVTATPVWRYNASGRSITSTYIGTGEYRVRFAGLGRRTANDREAVMVSAYGDNRHCQPVSWTTTGEDLDAQVRCHDATGALANSRFVILVADDTRPGAQLAFLHADQPTATGAYQPANQATRPGPGTATVERIGPGTWDISLNGFFRDGAREETFLVSAAGTTAARCAVLGWSYSSSSGSPSTLTVRCGTPGGTAADVPFVLVGLQ
ncbi:MAG TPA: Ig-like domain-containing protein [Gemmatimonadales bacterium]|nr:Ig-like domain-containing protein [Gemmatimonadales bacterium]